MSEVDSLGSLKPSDLLNHLEFILESDPLIDEVGFIHPSQFAALSDMSGTPSLSSMETGRKSADGSVESKISEVNPIDMVFWSRDHKLGISTQAIHSLYNAAKHSFLSSLEQYKELGNLCVNKDGSGDENALSTSCSSLASLESELMKHSMALLLLSCDFGTAWNCRKAIVSKKQNFSLYVNELLFSALVLSYSPKSERAWSHRRWVIKMIAGNCSNLQKLLENESELVKRMAEKSKMNYRAWNHRSWLVSYMSQSQVVDELTKCRDWSGLHVADNSCFHYRTRLMSRILGDSLHKQESSASPCHTAELCQLWKEELTWSEMLIKRYRGREALWLYRRFLSLSWIKHFTAHMSGNHTDLFIDNELELFRSCATIRDNVFEDYQSQAMFAAIYVLWLIKQMDESQGAKTRTKVGEELEELLNKVCPKKAFLWNVLRTNMED